MRGWLSGFFDGDGTTGQSYRKRRPSKSKFLQATNTDRSIIDYCCKCLDVLDIDYTVRKYPKDRPRKDVYHITINRADNILKWHKLVGFRCRYKSEQLQEIANWLNRPNAVRRAELPTREEIEALYFGKNLSYSEVGKRLGYTGDGNGVRHRMIKLGIPIRSPSEARKLSWRKDGPRRRG